MQGRGPWKKENKEDASCDHDGHRDQHLKNVSRLKHRRADPQSTWLPHWGEETEFRVWRGYRGRNCRAVSRDEGTMAGEVPEMCSVRPWLSSNCSMRERKLPKARGKYTIFCIFTTISEAHTGLGVVCIPNIQSRNTQMDNTQTIREKP